MRLRRAIRSALLVTLAALPAAPVACGDGDAEETAAATDAGPDATLPASETCKKYLDCLSAVDPAAGTEAEGQYAEGGTCWTSDASAAACDDDCEQGLAQKNAAFPNEPACGQCESNTDCTDPLTPVCDTSTRRCVRCLADSDCSANPYCVDQQCKGCVFGDANKDCLVGECTVNDTCKAPCNQVVDCKVAQRPGCGPGCTESKAVIDCLLANCPTCQDYPNDGACYDCTQSALSSTCGPEWTDCQAKTSCP